MNEASTDLADYDVVVESSHMLEMRDGVRLAQDVYRPARGGRPVPGRFPVLLERTPYGKQGVRESEFNARNRQPISRYELASAFARHGYVVIVQDCRGRHESEGLFTKYLDEAEDGYDTICWIGRQEWCDGNIGMFGLSYSAHTQTAAAALRPPGLKALVLDCGGLANAYRTGVRQGGAFEMKQATWAFKHARQSRKDNPIARAALENEDIAEWFRAWPWKRGQSPLRWAPEYESYFFDQLENNVFNAYWRQPALYAAGRYDAFEGLAVLLLSGWYDPYVQSTVENFIGLAARKDGVAEMILGPWLHGRRSTRHAGEVDFGPAATLDDQIAPDYLALRLDWFDHHLRGRPRRYRDQAVRYFRMGGGGGGRTAEGRLDHGGNWVGSGAWPPADSAESVLYLHAGGCLSEVPGGADAAVSFVHDPRRPVPTIGGGITSGQPVMEGGAFDQRTSPQLFGAHAPWLPLSARGDVLVFQTDPLDEDVEVSGTIRVKLWISADTPDVDFAVKLIDVYPTSSDYPQGFAMNLTDGILRCRYRKSWSEPEPLRPGEIVEIDIDPPPVSNLFKAGHRVRLDIAGSNFPRFDINPATGALHTHSQGWRLATQTVHCSAAHPSRLVLPVVGSRG